MTDFLQPWVWYAAGLVVICFLLYLAAYYEATRAPDEYHEYGCDLVDQEADALEREWRVR